MGFSSDVDQTIVEAAKLVWPAQIGYTDHGWDLHQGWLSYDKHEGPLVEFVNIGDMNNQILEFEAIISNGESSPSLAKTMTMFMVKDLLHKFDYPYKHS